MLWLVIHPVDDGEVEAEGGGLLQEHPRAVLGLELPSAVIREPGEQ